MKQIILMACALMTSMMLVAQDIIITKEAKKIDAKILEVSKTEIKYKELDKLEGPTFIAEMNDISSIIYSNGKVFIPESSQKSQDTLVLVATNQELQNNTENSSSEFDKLDGYMYISEGGEIKFKYDLKNKVIYLQSKMPLMYHSKDVRNIAIVYCHFDNKKDKYVIFDMSNKVNGVAILSGWNSFLSNINFHTYFKKRMPKSFEMEVPYETSHATYKMTLTN